MTDLYLIAHKVRGEPAFDIATQMTCPECLGHECSECDHLGYWWIIPTSGHRAYPYWWIGLHEVPDLELLFETAAPYDPRTTIPNGIPDHYPTRAAPTISLADALGLKPKKLPPIIRRL